MTRSLCLVVGGAGFIGSHIVDELLAGNYSVRVFDLPRRERTNLAHVLDCVEVVEGDFTNSADIERALMDVNYVLHLAGTTLPQTSNENPIYDAESNLIGTLRMLQAAQVADVKKVIFISSGGTVYGVPEKIPITETHPTQPICAYGITKLAIEKYLHLYYRLYGLDYVVLRVSNPYGERQQSVGAQQGVVSVFIDCLQRGQPIKIWGDGSVARDFIYVQNVARAFVLALTSTSCQHVFNVGSGVMTSLNDLLSMLARITGIKPRVEYSPGRLTDVPNNVLDTTLIRTELGWSAITPLEVGLTRTWNWACKRAPQVYVNR